MTVGEDGIGTIRVTDGNVVTGGGTASIRSSSIGNGGGDVVGFHGAVGGVSSHNAVLGHAAADVVNGNSLGGGTDGRSVSVVVVSSNRNAVGGTVFQGVGGGGAVGHGHLVGGDESISLGGHVVQVTKNFVPGTGGFGGGIQCIGSGVDKCNTIEGGGGGHVVVFVSVHGEDGAELLQVTGAADGAGFGTGLVQGRQKHAGEDGDDGDNHRCL